MTGAPLGVGECPAQHTETPFKFWSQSFPLQAPLPKLQINLLVSSFAAPDPKIMLWVSSLAGFSSQHFPSLRSLFRETRLSVEVTASPQHSFLVPDWQCSSHSVAPCLEFFSPCRPLSLLPEDRNQFTHSWIQLLGWLSLSFPFVFPLVSFLFLLL